MNIKVKDAFEKTILKYERFINECASAETLEDLDTKKMMSGSTCAFCRLKLHCYERHVRNICQNDYLLLRKAILANYDPFVLACYASLVIDEVKDLYTELGGK